MNRINESLRILLWSSVFIYVVIGSFSITQIDIWWQLSEGFHILTTFHLPTEPVAAFGLPAHPYFDEYAGYEVVLASIYKITGFPGLWMVFIAVYLAILFLPSFYARKANSQYDIFSCVALLIAGLLMKDRLEQRPELVGSLLQVLLMLFLRKTKLEEVTLRSAMPFLGVFVIWTNTHSSFLLGLFTVFIWMGCEVGLKCKSVPIALLLKKGALLVVVALAALMFNPYGPERLCFPFLQAFDPGSTALSVEMWPIMDMWGAAGIMAMIAIFLIAWAILTSRTTPLWLVIYSLFSAYMTFKSFRCVSLLAIALVFVYASRDAELKPASARFPLLILLRSTLLCGACFFMLFWDAYNLNLAYHEARQETYFATHTNGCAPEIVDSVAWGVNNRFPVLCGLDEGAYLSSRGNNNFRPMLDSGMSHFSDDTKRYFFFLLHEPEALDLALKDLHVNYVMINAHTIYWILVLERTPGWRMIACSSYGMLWQRVPGGIYTPSPSERATIAASRDALLLRGDVRNAFCYSTLIDPPYHSLAIFSNYGGSGYLGWSSMFYNYFRDWVSALPPVTIQGFLADRGASTNRVMDAVLAERLGPEPFASFSKKPSGHPPTDLCKMVGVEDALARGNKEEARKIFDTISKTQPASATYYGLWNQVQVGDSGASEERINAYGQWQTWDDAARKFMESVSGQLNDRIGVLDAEKP